MSARDEHPTEYDAIALDYDADNDNPFNALYERPASLALMPPLPGAHVLDAGCGAGLHAADMIRSGATVTGVDASSVLLDLARTRCPGATFVRADLAHPLDFLDTASFDAVLCALVLHYLEDWGGALQEFRRVLRPGGLLVVSTHHPAMDVGLSTSGDYFATELLHDRWTKNGRTLDVSFWRRPLTDMIAAFHAAGFAIDALREPRPLPECEERFPAEWELLTTKPQFVFFRLRPHAGPAR